MTTRNRNRRTALRGAVSQNVARLLQVSFSNQSDKISALSRKTKLSNSTIQRILSGESAATLDSIEVLAEAFKVAPESLLLPAGKSGFVCGPADTKVLAEFSKLSGQDQAMFLKLLEGYRSTTT